MGGGGGQKSTTTEQKEYKLPAWVEQASQENYGMAKDVANRPFEQYEGKTVADLPAEFYGAQGMLGNLDDYFGNYGSASSALTGMLGYNPAEINAGRYGSQRIAGQDIDPYLNPYIENVENRAISNAERSGQQAQDAIAAQAAQAKSFGGSRQAMQQAIQGAETTRGIGDLSANLRKQGYDTAMGYLGKDVESENAARKFNAEMYQKAQESSRQNEIQALTAKTGAAKQLTDTATAGQDAWIKQMAQYLGIGDISQQHEQAGLDRSREMWENEWNYPLEQLNIRLASLGMSPYGHTETGTSTTKTSGGGGGLMGAIGGMMPFLGQLGKFAFAGSDEDLKTDIQYVGQREDDIPVYAYRYKGDPKTYPKTVGPMAQDIEKKYPHAVKKVGGKRVVRLDYLTV